MHKPKYNFTNLKPNFHKTKITKQKFNSKQGAKRDAVPSHDFQQI